MEALTYNLDIFIEKNVGQKSKYSFSKMNTRRRSAYKVLHELAPYGPIKAGRDGVRWTRPDTRIKERPVCHRAVGCSGRDRTGRGQLRRLGPGAPGAAGPSLIRNKGAALARRAWLPVASLSFVSKSFDARGDATSTKQTLTALENLYRIASIVIAYAGVLFSLWWYCDLGNKMIRRCHLYHLQRRLGSRASIDCVNPLKAPRRSETY